jgi:hypothetical protein
MPLMKFGLALRVIVVCATAFAALPTRHAAAQDPYACIDQLSDEEVSHRLQFLVRRFEAGKRHARMHWYGWTTFSLGAVALTWTLYGLSRDDGHNESDPALVSAIGSVLLVAQQFAFPLVPAFAPQRLARIPESTPEERREKLRLATRYLERSAARLDMLRGISAHAGSMAFAIGTGTFLAVRHDEPLATTQAFLAPPVIAEAKILSLPWHAHYDWENYRAFACQVPEMRAPSDPLVFDAPPRDESPVAWSIVPAAGGLGLRLDF